jgi:hypothetical protein
MAPAKASGHKSWLVGVKHHDLSQVSSRRTPFILVPLPRGGFRKFLAKSSASLLFWIKIISTRYLEPPYEAWSFVLDESIKGAGGNELVSPILAGIPGLMKVYQVLRLLREFPEIQANETCGTEGNSAPNVPLGLIYLPAFPMPLSSRPCASPG